MKSPPFTERILKNPVVYWTYQQLVGGDRARKLFVEKYVHPQRGMKILDIGCGPGNILDFLPTDIEYLGLDISSQYIESAKKDYGHRGKFICSSVEDYYIENPNSYDVVLATGLLHHLDDSSAEHVALLAAKSLKEEGKFFTFDGCYTEKQHPVATYMLNKDRGKFIRRKKEYENIVRPHFKQVISNLDKTLFHIPYTKLIMECSI